MYSNSLKQLISSQKLNITKSNLHYLQKLLNGQATDTTETQQSQTLPKTCINVTLLGNAAILEYTTEFVL